MTILSPAVWRFALLPAALIAASLYVSSSQAQFNPPSTVFGSISDSGGTVEAGIDVEAYIGNTLCGTKGKTEFTGEGSARVTVYVVDVVSEAQTPGCGRENGRQAIRVKVGDRFAQETAIWDPGPVRLDITFGGATPVAIPTFTPAPTNTPGPVSTPAPNQTQGPVETIPPGSPGAGSPVPTSPRGGITSATPGQQTAGGDDDGGVPVWAIALLVLGGIGAIGGGVGYVMARSNRAQDDDEFPPPGLE